MRAAVQFNLMRGNDFDTVVIGSGAGGLAAALALARKSQQVLIIERHEVPGGWCHSFVMEEDGSWTDPSSRP